MLSNQWAEQIEERLRDMFRFHEVDSYIKEDFELATNIFNRVLGEVLVENHRILRSRGHSYKEACSEMGYTVGEYRWLAKKYNAGTMKAVQLPSELRPMTLEQVFAAED
jgi:hypothetical protein